MPHSQGEERARLSALVSRRPRALPHLRAAAIVAVALVLTVLLVPGRADADPADEEIVCYVSGCRAVESPAAQQVGTYRIVVPLVSAPDAPPPPPPPPRPPPGPPADFLALQAEMAAAISSYWVAGDYAVAVTDLQTGHTIHVGGDDYHLSGCVINLFVLFAAAREAHLQHVPWSQIEETVRVTIRDSNPVTARELYMLLGGGDPVAGTAVVDSYIKDTLGLERIVLDHPPGFVHETLGINYNNYVTANDVNKALAMLYGGFVVGENERSYMLDALAGVKPGLNYILGVLNGPGVVVGHKNGWFPSNEGYVDNDAGIIRFWRGDREYAFAMTFLTQGIAGEYAGVALGQELAWMALDYFLAKYPE